MSQRKAKEYRRAMEQYTGVAEDVDDLKRRVGALEARHYREDRDKAVDMIQRRAAAKKWEETVKARAMKKAEHELKTRAEERRRRIARRRLITLALGALAVVMLLASVIMTITAKPAAEAAEAEITGAAVTSPPVTLVTAEPDMWDGEGEDPLEAEKIEEALLASGYFSVAVPMCYEYQDYMRTYCAAYECPYPLALAVAEVESHFDMDAVGAAGEVGIMQLNPGPENTYWINLEAETELDPTTPSGNIAAGCYLLGKYMQEYGDANKAAMAYNMGVSGAENAWAEGITSTDYSTAVVEAMERWEVTVNHGMGYKPGRNTGRGRAEGTDPPLAGTGPRQSGTPGPRVRSGPAQFKPGGDPERSGGMGLRLDRDPGRKGVGGPWRKGGPNAYII